MNTLQRPPGRSNAETSEASQTRRQKAFSWFKDRKEWVKLNTAFVAGASVGMATAYASAQLAEKAGVDRVHATTWVSSLFAYALGTATVCLSWLRLHKKDYEDGARNFRDDLKQLFKNTTMTQLATWAISWAGTAAAVVLLDVSNVVAVTVQQVLGWVYVPLFQLFNRRLVAGKNTEDETAEPKMSPRKRVEAGQIASVAVQFVKSRLITHTPLALTHLVTSLCDARCKICDLWKRSPEHKDDMTRDEVFRMLDMAKRAGMMSYTVWGGEPLQRPDLPEIIRYAADRRFMNAVLTNGYYLKDRCAEIAPFTDFVVVSINSADDVHDRMLGRPGALERALAGIEETRRTKLKVLTNAVICKLNLDKIDGLLELSKKLGVAITFEPLDVTEYNRSIAATEEELKAAFSKLIEYKKRGGYRIGNSMTYMRMFVEGRKDYTCHAPKVYITVDAHGKVIVCCARNWELGNIRDAESFADIFGQQYRGFCKEALSCTQCNVSSTIETSLAYSLNPSILWDKLRNL